MKQKHTVSALNRSRIATVAIGDITDIFALRQQIVRWRLPWAVRQEMKYQNYALVVITLAVSIKLMNILARFSTDFSVTIVAATHVLSWKKNIETKEH